MCLIPCRTDTADILVLVVACMPLPDLALQCCNHRFTICFRFLQLLQTLFQSLYGLCRRIPFAVTQKCWRLLARGLYRDSQQIEAPVGMLRIGLEVAKSFKNSKTGKDKLYQGHLTGTLNLVVYKDGGEEELDQSDARKAVQLFYDYYVKRQRAPLAPKNDNAVGSAVNGKRSSTGRGAGRA